ncbi:hypothetical protein SAMN05660443_0727 [Marinospirillum celere]|uniref:DUF2066 domain-containing protein n=1 Tax=Marinospirillum celere TaxID=1122252 RepID=A0A1I1EPH0_9GAMM|nr:hypothetical protein SAMN05660443_0727 [Marinospirillum celere]
MKLIKAAPSISFLFFLCLVASQPLYADRVDNLYSLQTLVPDTSDRTRAKTANQLLQRLLVRVSGTEAVLEKMPPDDFQKAREEGQDAEPYASYREHEHYELWRELSNAQRWVSQYSYQSTQELIENEAGEQVRAHQLELDFDPSAINNLLQRMQAPVWDASRPKTLFFIALQGRQGRYLVTPESNESLSELLVDLAEERGIPMLLPASEEQLPSSLLSDIWGGFSREILAASQTYQPDAVAIGRIYPSSGTWAVNWQLFTGLDRVASRTNAGTLGEALTTGVNFVAESLSERYASSPDQGAGVYHLAITNIRQIRHFAQLMDYLGGLSLTNSVELVRVQDDQLLLKVDLRGGMNQLRANLSLDGRLTEASFYSLQQSGDQNFGLQPQQLDQDLGTSSEEPSLFRQVDAWFEWQAN